LIREAKANGTLKKPVKEPFFHFKPKRVDPNLKMFVQPPPGPENYPNKQQADD